MPEAQAGITNHIKSGNKKLAKKTIDIIDELYEHPRIGKGKPERLRGYDIETWSRRIDKEHRLVYEIHEDRLVVIAISAFGHYSDK